VGEILVERGYLTPVQVDLALREQRRTGEPLGRILVGLGLVTEEVLNRVLFEEEGTDVVSLRALRPEADLLETCGEETMRRGLFVPVRREGHAVLVAMANPGDVFVADEARRLLGAPVRVVVASREEILSAIREFASRRGDRVVETLDRGAEESGAAIRLVEDLLATATDRGATDLHLEPGERMLRVRYRVDGVLVPGENIPSSLTPAVLARVKLLAGCDLSEHRLPQDGRIRFVSQGAAVDLRVSVLPTVEGESLVLRLLDTSGTVPRLDRIGLPPEIEERIRAIGHRPNGMFLVTGPTGSGKSTTLFALLATIDAMERKVCTVEDPVEYRLPLLSQCQVRPEIGLTFAQALRSLLRQDPDVILVGETRDRETAEIAIRAALTGHVVFTTLHTTSAPGAVVRLLDLGIEPFLLSSTIVGVLAQRLVRKLCSHCRREEHADDALLTWLARDGNPLPDRFFRSYGCEGCGGRGYRGRIGIFELYLPPPNGAELLARKADATELAREAASRGFRPLLDDGRAKVRAGITTMEEVLRVTADGTAPG
jgi:type IV pilus assembly protein PilB